MSLRSSEMSISNSAELEGEVIFEAEGLGEEEEDNERPGVFNAEVVVNIPRQTSATTAVDEVEVLEGPASGDFLLSVSVESVNWKIQDCDPVEKVLKSYPVDSEESVMMQYDLLSVIVVDSVAAEPVSRGNDLRLLYDTTIQAVVKEDSLKKKESLKWLDRFFRFLPGEQWSPKLLELLKNKRASEPSAEFKANNKGKTLDVMKTLYFADCVMKRGKEVKAFITMHLNPQWIPENEWPSGTQSVHGLLNAILDIVWAKSVKEKAEEQAKNYWYARSRLPETEKVGKKAPAYIAAKPGTQQFEIEVQKRIEKAGQLRPTVWYPKEWLAFLLLAMPAGPFMVPSCSSGGRKSNATALEDLSLRGRVVRRMADELQDSGHSEEDGGSGKAGKDCKKIFMVHQREFDAKDETDLFKDEIESVERQLALTEKMLLRKPDSTELLQKRDSLEEKLLDLYSQHTDAIANKRAKLA